MLLVGMVLIAGILYIIVNETRHEEENLKLEQQCLKRELRRHENTEKVLQKMVKQRREERGVFIASQLDYPELEGSSAIGGGDSVFAKSANE